LCLAAFIAITFVLSTATFFKTTYLGTQNDLILQMLLQEKNGPALGNQTSKKQPDGWQENE